MAKNCRSLGRAPHNLEAEYQRPNPTCAMHRAVASTALNRNGSGDSAMSDTTSRQATASFSSNFRKHWTTKQQMESTEGTEQELRSHRRKESTEAQQK